MLNSEMNSNQDADFDEELYEHHKFVSPKGQSLLRVDKFLMQLIENATRNKIQQAATDGNIWVNDIPVKSNYRVKPFDVVRVMLSHPPFENHIIPEDIPLDIVYEDDVLLVINKPAGLVVHPGHGNYTGTLVNALAFHCDNLPMNSSERPGLVHRIDKNTSGLLTGIISIILFIVGLIVVINKNIKGKVKAIIVSIVVVAIVGLSIYYYSHI